MAGTLAITDPTATPPSTPDNNGLQQIAGQAANQVTPVQPSVTPAPPIVQTPQTVTSAPPKQGFLHPLAHALDSVLKQGTGGDVYYTDENGQRKLAPQSRGTLGKTLIAATLAGLLSKDQYRDTPYGPVRDYTGTMGNASEAAQSKVNEMRNRPQKLSDEEQTRKLMTIQNNGRLIALQSASAHLKHENQVENAEAVATTLSPFNEYESLRTANNDPSQPKAFLSQGLTHDQVLAKGTDGQPAHKLTDSNVIQDGWTEKWNEQTQQMEPEPTYAILNPALKDVALPKNVTDLLNKVNSQWKDIHTVVGGTVKVPVNAYVSAMHDYSAVMQGQQILNGLNKAVNGDDAKPLTVDAVAQAARASRDKGANILPALYQMSHAVAGGNVPDQTPDNLLDTLLKAPNGNQILSLLGLTPSEAATKRDEINAERVKRLALAKEGGIGDKAPADPDKVAQLGQLAKDLELTDAEAAIAIGKPNPDGLMTQGQYVKAVDKIQAQANANREAEYKKLQAGGDPILTKKTAQNIVQGDVGRLEKITSIRGTARESLLDAIHEQAAAYKLDTTRFGEAALANKANIVNDYNGNKKGSTGAQAASFNAFLGHTAEAVDNEKRLEGKTFGPGNTPLINIAYDKISKELTNDPDWKAYEVSLLPVQNEINNFLSAGFAVKAEDAALMQQATDKHETPARITAALRQLASTADIRLQAIGQRYLDAMGTTYPDLMSIDSINTLKRLGIQSKATPLSQAIPKGWQDDQPSPPSQQVLQQIFQLAGRDVRKATELARENGWLVADPK